MRSEKRRSKEQRERRKEERRKAKVVSLAEERAGVGDERARRCVARADFRPWGEKVAEPSYRFLRSCWFFSSSMMCIAIILHYETSIDRYPSRNFLEDRMYLKDWYNSSIGDGKFLSYIKKLRERDDTRARIRIVPLFFRHRLLLLLFLLLVLGRENKHRKDRNCFSERSAAPPDESLKIYPKFHVRPIFARTDWPRTGYISGDTGCIALKPCDPSALSPPWAMWTSFLLLESFLCPSLSPLSSRFRPLYTLFGKKRKGKEREGWERKKKMRRGGPRGNTERERGRAVFLEGRKRLDF